MEGTYFPIKSVQLYSSVGLASLDLHSCCSDLVVTFDRSGRTKTSNSIYDVSFFQFLDDPVRGHPLRKATSCSHLAPHIRFSFAHPDTLQCNSSNYLESFGVGLSDIFCHDCDFFMAKFPSAESCIHCLVKNNYSDWSALFPALKKLSFMTSSLLYKYSDFLSKYDEALAYEDVFSLPLEPDTSGKYVCVVGSKDFVSFTDIGVEKRYWKVFWLAVIRKYPMANRRIWFTLHVQRKEGPITGWRVQLDTLVRTKIFSRFVMVPLGSNIWCAIVYLFAHAPPNSEKCGKSPMDCFD